MKILRSLQRSRTLLCLLVLVMIGSGLLAQADGIGRPNSNTQDGIAIEKFVFLDATNDVDLFVMTDGMIIDLRSLPVTQNELSIRADVSSSQIGSILFNLNGKAWVENVEPFTLFMNLGNDYFPGSLPVGDYILTATPFTGNRGNGVAGTPLTIHFSIIRSPIVTQFVLVDAINDVDLFTITDGMLIDFDALSVEPNEINIRADVEPSTVGSVYFELMGARTLSRMENVFPYSLFEDNDGDYKPDTLPNGDYVLSATPYDSANRAGQMGITNTISFSVRSTPQDVAPFVMASTPVNGVTNIPANTAVSLMFSEPVNLSGEWFLMNCTVSGTRSVGLFLLSTPDNITFTLQPLLPFAFGESCTATVFAAGVTDQDVIDPPDMMLADYVFSFSTAPPPDDAPYVVATSPRNGSVNVPLSSNISITFSEPVHLRGAWIDISCTTSGVHNEGSVISEDDTTFVLSLAKPFNNAENCTVTIFAAQVSDVDQNDPPDNMLADYTFRFNTSFISDQVPFVLFTRPINNASNVPVNSSVSIIFNEPVNTAPAWTNISCTVSGDYSLGDNLESFTLDHLSYTLTPSTPFANAENCTVTILAAAVTDVDTNDPPDNMFADYVFEFSMVLPPDEAPFISSTIPVNNAVDVPTDSMISLTFSEPVNVSDDWVSVVCPVSGTRNVDDFTVTNTDNVSFVLAPLVPFSYLETCTVTVNATGVTDVDNNDPPNRMTTDYVFQFTIIESPDDAPSVVSHSPLNGATSVARNTSLSLTFSEPVDIESGGVVLSCATSGVQIVTVTSVDDVTYTGTPSTVLGFGEVCSVTVVANLVFDQDGINPPINMDNDYVFSFTTVFDPAPTVFSTSPANGATNVPIGNNIIVAFSEPVEAQASAFNVSCGGNAISIMIISTTDKTIYTVVPDIALPVGQTCTVVVDRDFVTDVDLNDPFDHMVNDYQFSFTTRP